MARLRLALVAAIVAAAAAGWWPQRAAAEFLLLEPESFRPLFHDVKINASGPTDQGPLNEQAFAWAKANVPFFESSDKDLEAAYAFRWRAYFTHLIPTNQTTNPWVVSECFSPTIPGRCSWAAPSGAINAAAGHHIREGRWIRDPIYMDSEIRFWFGLNNGPGGSLGANGAYSSWIQHAAWQRAKVTGDTELFKQTSADGESNETLLQLMVAEFDAKEQQTRLDWENKQPHSPDVPHCYSILDGWDAMEGSISGGGCRPSNNAMFYGNALAIAELASAVGNTTLAANFSTRARAIQEMYMGLLWNPAIEFFAVYKDGTNAKAGKHNATNGIPFGANSVDDRNAKWVCGSGHPNGDPATPAPAPNQPGPVPVRPQHCPQTIINYSWPCNATVGVRELLGLGPPWYFEVPWKTAASAKYLKSWQTLFDPDGFQARWGPTTVERRNRCFNWTADTGECNWAGPSWPYETSRVITGLSNLLNNYPVGSGLDGGPTKGEKAMTKEHYMQVLRQYAVAHTRSHPANSSLPYIGESIEPDLGFWQARAIMYGQEPSARGYQPPKPDRDRSVDYNHSTFADLIIEGLIGLRAALGSLFTINPLATGLSYFAIDNVAYHNHSLTVAWDEDGVRNYTGCKQGLCVWADGKLIGTSPVLKKLQLSLPNADLDV